MQRFGWVIKLKPEAVDRYRELHANAWPQVLTMISECNIRNYSIFLREPELLLFGVYEYVGTDFVADMQRMAGDPATREWWRLTDPCQMPLASTRDGEHWAPMVEIFHHD